MKYIFIITIGRTGSTLLSHLVNDQIKMSKGEFSNEIAIENIFEMILSMEKNMKIYEEQMANTVKIRTDSKPHYHYKYVNNDETDKELFLETPLNYVFGDKLNIVGCKSIFMLLKGEQEVLNGKENLNQIISILSKIIDVNFIILTRNCGEVVKSRKRVGFTDKNIRNLVDIDNALDILKSLEGNRIHQITYEKMINPTDDTLKNIFGKMKIKFDQNLYAKSMNKRCSY